jgi:hypothetical protein
LYDMVDYQDTTNVDQKGMPPSISLQKKKKKRKKRDHS